MATETPAVIRYTNELHRDGPYGKGCAQIRQEAQVLPENEKNTLLGRLDILDKLFNLKKLIT